MMRLNLGINPTKNYHSPSRIPVFKTSFGFSVYAIQIGTPLKKMSREWGFYEKIGIIAGFCRMGIPPSCRGCY